MKLGNFEPVGYTATDFADGNSIKTFGKYRNDGTGGLWVLSFHLPLRRGDFYSVRKPCAKNGGINLYRSRLRFDAFSLFCAGPAEPVRKNYGKHTRHFFDPLAPFAALAAG